MNLVNGQVKLIETYWNVKEGAGKKAVDSEGINRNILECKACVFSIFVMSAIVLIETYWNVKFE